MSNEFFTPQSRNEAILQNICGANNVLQEPQSKIEKLLQAILYEDETIVDFTPESRIELLLYAILTHGECDVDPQSRNETILKAILTNGEYDALPQSRIEALLIEWLDQTHYEEKTASGDVVSISDAVNAPVVDLTAAIVPVQSGSGDPSPENIRPISGWAECNVTRAGKNLFDIDGYLTDRSVSYTKSGDTYTITATTSLYTDHYIFSDTDEQVKISYGSFANGTTTNVRIDVMNTNGTIVKTIYPNTEAQTVTAKKIRFNWTDPGNFTISKLQIERGSSATSYEPYRGDTYTVTFGSAGTVYGGTLDVTTGKLTVTEANIASYNGETLPGAWISDRDVYAAGTTPTIGAQVVYELAEPIVYNLTPVEIRMLEGQNTIWADTGSVTVTYKARRTAAALMMMAGRF